MVKRSKNSGKASSHIDFESDNEELIDEINAFHKKDRQVDPKSYARKKKHVEEEVLNVEGEASESGEESEGSDFDDDDEEVKISSNQWGKKRKDFYGTGYVDEDWGGMRDEEMQDAELEEEDALARQKELDKSVADFADIFDGENDEEQEEGGVEVSAETLEFNLANAKKQNKKTKKYIEEFNGRQQLFDLLVRPLQDVIRILPPSPLRTQLVYCTKTYSAYLLNVAYYLKLKSAQLVDEKISEPMIDSHPVTESIAKLTKKMGDVETFLYENSHLLDILRKWAATDEDRLREFGEDMKELAPKKKKGSHKVQEEEEEGELVVGKTTAKMYTTMDETEKRMATTKIAKNKLGADGGKNKKKDAKTSRTKNRKKVRAIEKRVKSQVAPVRREMDKYSGEAKGIRSATIKSTKLLA